VKIKLTDAGNAIVAKAPQVAQGLLVAGLEVLPQKNFRIYLMLWKNWCIYSVRRNSPRD
jgi:hypothetical protein